MIRVVVGILTRAQTLLVAQRPPGKSYSGYWEFPGGKVEPAETSVAALRRELKEELNIDILNATLLLEHQHHYPDKTVQLEIWQVTDFCNEPCGHENQIIRWVTFAEMQQLNILEGNLAIMDQIKLALK